MLFSHIYIMQGKKNKKPGLYFQQTEYFGAEPTTYLLTNLQKMCIYSLVKRTALYVLS